MVKAMSKKKKALWLTLLLAASMTLTACGGNSATQSSQSQSASATSSKSKEDEATVQLYTGEVVQAQNLYTVPISILNGTTETLDLSSNNFYLKVLGRYTFKPFQVSGEASDFHESISANATYQNVLTFRLGTTLNAKQLAHTKLYYKTSNGDKVVGKALTSEVKSQSFPNNTPQGYTAISKYYSDLSSFMEQNAPTFNSENKMTDQLASQFDDKDYADFRMWAVASKYNADKIYIKAVNNTASDFYIDFDNMELVNGDGNEVHINPEHQDDIQLVPHGKSVNLVIPLETKIKESDGPFTIKFRTDSNASFEDTKQVLYPAEFAFTNSKKLEKAFIVSADQYPSNLIRWRKLKLKGSTATVKLEINDIFALDSKASNYRIIGMNKDGTVGDTIIPKSMTPSGVITSSTTISFDCSNLSSLSKYKTIVFKYRDKTLLKQKN